MIDDSKQPRYLYILGFTTVKLSEFNIDTLFLYDSQNTAESTIPHEIFS